MQRGRFIWPGREIRPAGCGRCANRDVVRPSPGGCTAATVGDRADDIAERRNIGLP
jgi:hypothetical protein